MFSAVRLSAGKSRAFFAALPLRRVLKTCSFRILTLPLPAAGKTGMFLHELLMFFRMLLFPLLKPLFALLHHLLIFFGIPLAQIFHARLPSLQKMVLKILELFRIVLFELPHAAFDAVFPFAHFGFKRGGIFFTQSFPLSYFFLNLGRGSAGHFILTILGSADRPRQNQHQKKYR